MRCKACDSLLNNVELKRKNLKTGTYEELCTPCLGYIASDIAGSIDPEDELWDDVDEDDEEEGDDEDAIKEPEEWTAKKTGSKG